MIVPVFPPIYVTIGLVDAVVPVAAVASISIEEIVEYDEDCVVIVPIPPPPSYQSKVPDMTNVGAALIVTSVGIASLLRDEPPLATPLKTGFVNE